MIHPQIKFIDDILEISFIQIWWIEFPLLRTQFISIAPKYGETGKRQPQTDFGYIKALINHYWDLVTWVLLRTLWKEQEENADQYKEEWTKLLH